MKKIIFFVFLLMLVSIVAAEDDFIFRYNSDDIVGPIVIKVGDSFKFEVNYAANILIKNIVIDSDNSLVESIMNQYVSRPKGRQTERRHIVVPMTMPNYIPIGTYQISVLIDYEDSNFSKKVFKRDFVIEYVGKDTLITKLIKILPNDAAIMLMNAFTGYKIPRENTDLTLYDLSERDLQDLGFSPELFFEALKNEDLEKLPVIEFQKSQTVTILNDPNHKNDNQNSGGKIGDTISGLPGNVYPEITITYKTFKVSFGDKEIIKTKVTVTVKSGSDVFDISTVQIIPKEFANSVNDVFFSENPVIIEEDPVVQWAFSNIPKEQAKDYTFVVDNVGQYNADTISVSRKPGVLSRIITWIVLKFVKVK